MKSLEILTEEVIQLLKDSNLLFPLVRSQIIKETLDKIKVDINKENEAIKDFLLQYGIKDKDENYDKWRQKNNLTEEEIRRLALKKIRFEIFSEENFAHKIETHFLERKNDLDRFVYSLIRIQDAFKAKELFIRLISKEARFDELAFEHSEGPEKLTRGIVGPLGLKDAHPALAKVLRSAKTGEIVPPFQIKDKEGNVYFLIVRLEVHAQARLDKSMRQEMLEVLFDNWIAEQANNYISSINRITKTDSKSGES